MTQARREALSPEWVRIFAQAWPEACAGGAPAIRGLLVYSASLLYAPWSPLPAPPATQHALSVELLRCNAVGSFLAASQHVDVGALGAPMRLVSQLVLSPTQGFASQFVAAGGLLPAFTSK